MVNTPHARIKAISYALPEAYEDNAYLAAAFPEWSADKIAKKTGINRRHIAGKDEFASHLGVAAAQRLSAEHGIDLASVPRSGEGPLTERDVQAFLEQRQ